MDVFLVVVGLGALGGVVYLAVSKNSSLMIRLAALAALAIMVTAVIVCIITYVKYAAIPRQLVLPDMLPSELPPPEPSQNMAMIVMFIIFLIALFVMVAVMALKEQGIDLGKIMQPAKRKTEGSFESDGDDGDFAMDDDDFKF